MIDKINRYAIVVLGLGRSGTSLLMQVLSVLGMKTSENLVSARAHNTLGPMEDSEIVEVYVNDLLSKVGSHRLLPFPYDNFNRDIQNVVKNKLSNILKKNIDVADTIWGFKEAFTSCLLPLWFPIFNQTATIPIFLLAVRNPANAITSRKKHFDVSEHLTELSWLTYFTESLHHTAADCYIVHYEDWFTRPGELARGLLKYTGLNRYFTGDAEEVIKDMIKPNLNRSLYEDYQIENEYVLKLYDVLKDCRGDKFDRKRLMEMVKECRKAMDGFKGWYMEAQQQIGQKNQILEVLSKEQDRKNNLKDTLAKADAQVQELREAKDAVDEQIKQVLIENDQIKEQKRGIESELDAARKQIDEKVFELESAKKSAAELDRAISQIKAKADAQVQELREAKDAADEQIMQVLIENDQIKEQKRGIESELDAARKQIDEKVFELESAKKRAAELEQALSQVKSKSDAQVQELREAKDAADEQIKQVLIENEQMLQKNDERILEMKNDLYAITLQNNEYLKQVKELHDELKERRISLCAIRNELKQARSTKNNPRKQNQVVQQTKQINVEKYEKEVFELRNSYSFRIGQILVNTVAKPGVNTIIFPFLLIKLFFGAIFKRNRKMIKRK